MKHTKNDLFNLIYAFSRESEVENRANWLISLHPGYRSAKTKEWRSASKDIAVLATKGLVCMMNSFLNNSRSESNYVKGIVVIELSGRGHWHSHLIIRQTIFNEGSFSRKLAKVASIVNNQNYLVRIDNREYGGSLGIGYDDENDGKYMHYTKLDCDTERQCDYLLKSNQSMIGLLTDRTLFNDFFTIKRCN